uniref:Uncharacterized protein n=1 Tax=Sphaerodactylus townsendi TaxID=933632 RepID=A0ACB8FNQ5_9SAUR
MYLIGAASHVDGAQHRKAIWAMLGTMGFGALEDCHTPSLKVCPQGVPMGSQIRLYARPDAIRRGSGDYALNITRRLIEFYEDYFKVPYSLPKLGAGALPQPGPQKNPDTRRAPSWETAELGNPQQPPSPSPDSLGDFMGPEAEGGRRGNAPAVPDQDCTRPKVGGGATESPHRTDVDTSEPSHPPPTRECPSSSQQSGVRAKKEGVWPGRAWGGTCSSQAN